MQDAELQQIYCRWAHEMWPSSSPPLEVRFELKAMGPYSEVTPDIDVWEEIVLIDAKGRKRKIHRPLHEIIESLTRFVYEENQDDHMFPNVNLK